MNGSPPLDEIIDNISRLLELEEIDLSLRNLSYDDIVRITDILRTKENLQKLNLCCVFTTKNHDEIVSAVKKIFSVIEDKPISELNISNNALAPGAIKEMKKFLTQNVNLQSIIVDDTGLGKLGGEILFESILNSKSQSSFLKTLSARANVLGSSRTTPLLGKIFIKHNTTLTKVCLSRNNLNFKHFPQLLKGLKSCRGLEFLDLEDNNLSGDLASQFGSYMNKWSNLKHMNVSSCFFTSIQVNFVLNALSKKSNTKLEFLGLQYNYIDDDGYLSLADTIRKCLKDLTRLELNGNMIMKQPKCYDKLKKSLKSIGHPDALDDLNDMQNESDDESSDDGSPSDGSSSDDESKKRKLDCLGVEKLESKKKK
ncbi:12853_t:CDS:2 [Funneliformis geosporum]|uniref:7496_t:CDS:1 n=1 Tax=Funneliformis geosporum TaxID=1117311 RepID=A0A9W4SFA4_9GLOM|nr:7496_t:CDS:2 [Funneliformis geosporum]CAI2180137.1 12853_t:CDS:2 [Funneliformis geosporum]